MSYPAAVTKVLSVTGKKVTKTVTCPNTGEDFSGYNSADTALADLGYSVGSMCYPQPTAAIKTPDAYVAKWKNIKTKEWAKIDAMIVGDDYRNGNCTVFFLE